jgi:hypothetical protein
VSVRVYVKEKVKVKIFFKQKEGEKRNVLKKKVGYTGGRFRSYVLWGVSHNHPQVVPSPRGGLVEREKTVFNSALPLRHTGKESVCVCVCVCVLLTK